MISNLLPSNGKGVQLLSGAPVQLGCSWSIIHAGTQNREELSERVPLWLAGGVRRQVSRDATDDRGVIGSSASPVTMERPIHAKANRASPVTHAPRLNVSAKYSAITTPIAIRSPARNRNM